MISCKFCHISKNTFFIEHLWWLYLTNAMPYVFIRLRCSYKPIKLSSVALPINFNLESQWKIFKSKWKSIYETDVSWYNLFLGGILGKRCSQKLGKIHRKTFVLESLFKVAGLKLSISWMGEGIVLTSLKWVMHYLTLKQS